MTKDEQMNKISSIMLCYNTERDIIHEEFWKVRDVEKFSSRIQEIQDLRYERLKEVFE